MDVSSRNKYDPNVIIQAANETLLLSTISSSSDDKNQDIGRGKMIFQQALMDWTDDSREGVLDNHNSNEYELLQEAITTLWIAYSQFLSNAKQYKSSMEAYEQAVTECPFPTGRLYLEYARFAEERSKYKIAQEVYIRALVRKTLNNSNNNNNDNQYQSGAIQDEQDRQLLWNDFLEMMRNSTNSTELTLQELQKAVEEKEQIREQKEEQENEEEEYESDENNSNEDEESGGKKGDGLRSRKRLKTENHDEEEESSNESKDGTDDDSDDGDKKMKDSDQHEVDEHKTVTVSATASTVTKTKKKNVKASTIGNKKTHVILSDSIELEANRILDEWRNGTTIFTTKNGNSKNKKKSMLFSNNSNQQKIQSTRQALIKTSNANIPFDDQLVKLTADIMAGWMILDGNEPPTLIPEIFLFQPTTPKLSDPTAKDILGIDLSIEVIHRLLESSGDIVLNVCNGLWTLQALKHKETSEELKRLDEAMLAEYEQFESVLEARLSGASSNQNVSLRIAVEQMNNNERENFETTCSTKRIGLLTKHTWAFRQLLHMQQIVLLQLDVPTFIEPTIDLSTLQIHSNVCKYLHSAFYIRSRMGLEPHESMLHNQLKRLEKERDEPPRAKSISPIPPSGNTMMTHSPIPNPSVSYQFGSNPQQKTLPPPMPMDQQQPQYILQPQPVHAAPIMDYPMQQQPSFGQPPSPYGVYSQPGVFVQQLQPQQPFYYAQQQQQPGMMMMMNQQQLPPPSHMMQQQQQQPFVAPGYGQMAPPPQQQPLYPPQQQQQPTQNPQYPYYHQQ